MIDKFLEVLNQISLEVFCLFIIFFGISFFWKKIFWAFSLKTYQSKQRLHENEIPRIGGIIIYLFVTFLASFVIKSHLFNLILISAIPIIIIGGKEDLFHNTSPKLRLIGMILSAFLFIYFLPSNLPEINFPLLNLLLTFSVTKLIFFIFSILVIMNGNNLIDGVNGNMALSNIAQLCVIALLAMTFDDVHLVKLCFIFLIPLFVFLIFNYPFGKIFIGDVGAYFYGFSISALIMYLFGKHYQLLSWNAILILIYPSIELLFSFVRKKFFENNSPFSPDANHLHSLIFRYFAKRLSLTNNSFVIIFLLPMTLAPFLAYFFSDNIFSIIFSIFIIFLIYTMMYLYFLSLNNKK
jgi:UDP-GlcNAc:undecaprenyl-phosphate/decaprenyl-phosphate GlcNAc-1-phosphate transferase